MSTDPETGQTVISGMGELHLEIIVDRLAREFKIAANVGRPQVAYRETSRRPPEHEETFVHEARAGASSLRSDAARTGEPGRGLLFENALAAGALPRSSWPLSSAACAARWGAGRWRAIR